MRYILWLIVALSDVLLVVACAYVLFAMPLNPLVWIVVIAAVKTWEQSGGFMAWRKHDVRAYLDNAKRLGL